MKIDQLKKMPIGEKVGGFELSVKTFKKTWQVGNIWFSQVILMDETGEMPADVKMGKKNIGLRSQASKIRIIVCEVQEAEYLGKDRKKLYVDQYTTPTITVDEWEAEQDSLVVKWEKEVEGKIRHGLTCSYIRADKEINKPEIEALVKYIMTGE